jgi:acetylornithine deacetylase
MSYWADSAFLSTAGIPTVLYGPEGEGAHADIEWVSRSGTTTTTDVLIHLARDFCS